MLIEQIVLLLLLCYVFWISFEILLFFNLYFYLYFFACKTDNTYQIIHKNTYKHTKQVTFTRTYYNTFFIITTFLLRTKVFTTTSYNIKKHKKNIYAIKPSPTTYNCNTIVLIILCKYMTPFKIALIVYLTNNLHALLLFTFVKINHKIR